MKLDSIVDGTSLSYFLDNDGNIQIGQIPAALLKKSSKDTLQNVSKIYQTVSISIGKPISAIYDQGILVRSNREGIWLKPCPMKLTELATYSFPLNILNYVLEICQKMSITNKGYTIVIIKDAELKYSSPLLSDCQFSATKLNHLKDTEVMKLAALDGALILNINNIILGVGQRLEPPSETVYVKEPGRGSRHDSAAKYTGAIDCVVFVVSENGPITIFFKGDKFARCYQEIFGYQ